MNTSSPSSIRHGRFIVVPALALLSVGVWAYWPTLQSIAHCWTTQPDYSHGFLVPLVAAVVLHLRRASFPGLSPTWSWWGVLLLALALVLRVCGALFYLDAFDHWSLVLWIAGIVALLAGPRVLWWSSPALVFLLLALPLPFRVEHLFSQPLQRVAAVGSVWMLQTLGLPAFAEGNIILLGEHRLEVEQACAGLRIFMGIAALTFAAAAVSRRSNVERGLLLASALPVAVAANICRIVATAMCFTFGPREFARTVAHDGAGWIMIPLALALVAALHWFLSRVLVETTPLAVTDALARARPRNA